MLSIIIPAHNEAFRIGSTLESYVSYFSSRGESFEIIMVVNGCSDNTGEIVSQYSKKFGQIRMHSITGKGKGRAIKAGFTVATGDLLAFTDADGATGPEELGKLITHMGQYDGVIASRWLPQSVIFPGQSLPRVIASRSWNLLVRMVLGLPFKDTQCGAKVFTRTAISTVMHDLTVHGFAFDVEFL